MQLNSLLKGVSVEKKNSMKKNIFFGVLNTVVNTVFPIVIFAIVAPALSPAGLGINQFASSLVGCFILFATLGIPLYGTKLIARLKLSGKNEEVNKKASALFFINCITTVIILAAYICFIFLTSKTQKDVGLYIVYGVTIVASLLSVEWYFQASERFAYIAIRNLIVKIISLICIFIFIKSPSDYFIYAIICCGGILLYSLVNFLKFIKEVKLSFKNLEIKPHIKPIMTIFAMNVITSIYVSMDSIMLGFMLKDAGDFAVGQYTNALKTPRTVLAMLVSISTILIPRLSYYHQEKRISEFKNIINKTFMYYFAISIPATIGIIFCAQGITLLLSGAMYLESVTAMKIISVTLVLVCMTNLIGIQIFYNTDKTKYTLISVAVGAVINLILNLIFIPTYSYLGAAITTVIAEFSVLLVQLILGRKMLFFKIFSKDSLKVIIAAIFMTTALYLRSILLSFSVGIGLVVDVLVGVGVYMGSLLIMRHSMCMYVMGKIMKWLKKEKHDV